MRDAGTPRAARSANAKATPSAAPPKLVAAIDGWLDELRRGRRLSPRTVDAYALDLSDYAGFAGHHRLRGWDEATTTFVDGYFATL